MGTEEMNEASDNEKHYEKPGQISFTLKVVATDLPLEDENFKMKLIMDFGPEFSSDFRKRNTGPNFNAKRVRSLLRFVSDDVIRKIIEFVYYKNTYFIDDNPTKLIDNDTINRIYKERSKYRAEGHDLGSKPGLDKEEEIISKIVNELIDDEGRDIPVQEKNIASVRYDELSVGKMWANVQTIVNGDMPPP